MMRMDVNPGIQLVQVMMILLDVMGNRSQFIMVRTVSVLVARKVMVLIIEEDEYMRNGIHAIITIMKSVVHLIVRE